jgi:hypothetical protein
MEAVEFLRVTAVNTYIFDCQAKYFFRDIEKIKSLNSFSLAVGSSVHKALEINYSQKMITHQDLLESEVLDAFSDSFEEHIIEVDPLDLQENDRGKTKDNGIDLIKKYQNEVSPKVQPLAVEQRINLSFNTGAGVYKYGLTGQVDLYDSNFDIIDHKTTASERSFKMPVSDSYKMQMTAYKLLAESTGKIVNNTKIDMLKINDKPEINSKPIETDSNYYLKMFTLATQGIEKGVFMPNRTSFLCSKKYCKFWNECEKHYGGKIKE